MYIYKFMYMCIKSNAAAFPIFKMATVPKRARKPSKKVVTNGLPPEPAQQCDSKLITLFSKVFFLINSGGMDPYVEYVVH